MVDAIRHRLLAAYDRERSLNRYADLNYLYGCRDGKAITKSGGALQGPGGILLFPSIRVEDEEKGTLKDSLFTGLQMYSRIMTVDPEPDFKGIPEHIAQIRKAFWRKRYGFNGPGGNWHGQVAPGWLESLFNGVGAVRAVLENVDHYGKPILGKYKEREPEAQYQRVALKHAPMLRTVTSDLTNDPYQSPFVGWMDPYPLALAEMLFGEGVRKYAEPWGRRYSRRAQHDTEGKVVLITEYFDLGMNGEAPVHAMFYGKGADMNLCHLEDSPHGGNLPIRYRMVPGLGDLADPVGRLSLQRPSEELKQLLIDDLKRIAESGGAQRIFAHGMFTDDNLEDIRNPKSAVSNIVADKPLDGNQRMEHMVALVPPIPTNPALEKLDAIMTREQTQASGLSETQRGYIPERKEHATTMALMAQAGLANSSSETFATIRFFHGMVDMVMGIARDYDTEPVRLNVFGEQVLFNDPQQPRSQVAEWFEEEAEVVINEQSLTGQDDVAAQSRRSMALDALAPYVDKGVDRRWYVRQRLNVAGFYGDEPLMESGPTMPQGAPQDSFPAEPGAMAQASQIAAGMPQGA